MIILYNAKVHTLDFNYPSASALAIDQGRILALGSDQEILARFGGVGQANQRLYNLEGRVIIPGLTDAHIHLEHYALGLQKVDCETATQVECLERVARRARTTPAGSWVLGHGWNQNNWLEGFGDPTDLDRTVPDHPVFLTAKSLHAAWANATALRLASITANTPDPPDGRLSRDAHGNPTGLLFESAMELVYAVIPEPTVEEVAEAIHTAQNSLWRVGLTGVHDFDRRRCFRALQSLHRRGVLQLRVIKSIPLEDLQHAAALGLHTGFGDDFLRIGSVKAFSDGALGPQTAAMLQPYEGNNGGRGMLFMDAEDLFEKGRLAVENGLSLAVHAIGDRANHEVLTAYANLRHHEETLPGWTAAGDTRLRHRIEHVQLIHPDDAGRLAELGVVASMQPIHATSDMRMADRFWGERAAFSYAWRNQLQHGARLAFGSDAPVESPNPFWGLHAAVTRRSADGAPGPNGWYPDQRLDVIDALRGFTTGAAYAGGQEDRLGQLAPTYLADLLVLDTDPFTCEPEQLRDIQPRATMVGGDWVYSELA